MKFFEELKEQILSENLFGVNEILEKIQYEKDAFNYVDALFRIMEENPNLDYGSPGPIVHFIEKFGVAEYESLLIDSISRCPTPHTLWMLNRIINISNIEMKECYLNLLKSLLDRTDISMESRNEAKRFYQFQNNN